VERKEKALTDTGFSNTAEESEVFSFLEDGLPKKVLASQIPENA
jgi:hypothetical protein